MERTPSGAGLVGGGQRFGLFQFHLFATTLQASWSRLGAEHLGAADFTPIATSQLHDHDH